MIEKMTKYNFLIYHRDYQEFLYRLRNLGIVHVTQKQSGVLLENDSLSHIIDLEKRYSNAVISLHQINEKEKVDPMLTIDDSGKKTLSVNRAEDGTKLLEQVETLFSEKDSLTLEKQSLRKELDRIVPLDDFDPASLDRFRKRNWHLHLHFVAESKFNPQWEEDYNAIIFKKNGTQLYFATFGKEENMPPIEAEHIQIPEKSAAVLRKELQLLENRTNEVWNMLKMLAKDSIETLRYQHAMVSDDVNFEKVQLSADKAAEDRLMVLTGYVPAKDEEQTSVALEKEAIYFTTAVPTIEDLAPVKYKNNKFARTFEMITDLYDRPSYSAFDLTPFYAPFYIVFFGLCLGDCGYGLLALLASLLIKKKAKSDFMKSVGQLATYLGIGTMIFGFISGTFFGLALPAMNWAWLQPLKKIMLNSDQLFYLALGLGVVQITFAMIIKGITTWIRYGFLYALDTFGWLLMLLGIGITLILGNSNIMAMIDKEPIITSELQKTLLIVIISVTGAMMLLFNSPEKGAKGIPGSIGSGLYGLFNKITGLLGDLLSYIRLFALGISGSVLGSVFNFLAVSFAPDVIIVRELVMIVILLFGHSINIFLSGLGAFVHPLRLTFVEFYNNAGFEGGGKAYTPFKKQAE